MDIFVFEVSQKKNTTSFQSVANLFSLNPNLSTLFFYAPLHQSFSKRCNQSLILLLVVGKIVAFDVFDVVFSCRENLIVQIGIPAQKTW